MLFRLYTHFGTLGPCYAHLELVMDSQNMHSMRLKCVRASSFSFLEKKVDWTKGKKGKKEEKAILLYFLQQGLIRIHFLKFYYIFLTRPLQLGLVLLKVDSLKIKQAKTNRNKYPSSKRPKL